MNVFAAALRVVAEARLIARLWRTTRNHRDRPHTNGVARRRKTVTALHAPDLRADRSCVIAESKKGELGFETKPPKE